MIVVASRRTAGTTARDCLMATAFVPENTRFRYQHTRHSHAAPPPETELWDRSPVLVRKKMSFSWEPSS
ncbi:hypothetical protein D3C72_2269710 [compost metagenome]